MWCLYYLADVVLNSLHWRYWILNWSNDWNPDYTSNLLCVPENFCMKVLGDVLYISVDGEIRGHDLKLNRPKDFSGNIINQIWFFHNNLFLISFKNKYGYMKCKVKSAYYNYCNSLFYASFLFCQVDVEGINQVNMFRRISETSTKIYRLSSYQFWAEWLWLWRMSSGNLVGSSYHRWCNGRSAL